MRNILLILISVQVITFSQSLTYKDGKDKYAMTYDSEGKVIFDCVKITKLDKLGIIDSIDIGLTFCMFESKEVCDLYKDENSLTYHPSNRENIKVDKEYCHFKNTNGNILFINDDGTLRIETDVNVYFNHWNLGLDVSIEEIEQ